MEVGKSSAHTCTVQSCNFRCRVSQKLKHCPATNFCIQIFVCLLCVNSKHHAFLYQDIICTFHHIMYCTSITSEDRKNIGRFKGHTEKRMILLHVHVGRFAKLTMYILYMQDDFAHGKLIAWYMYVFYIMWTFSCSQYSFHFFKRLFKPICFFFLLNFRRLLTTFIRVERSHRKFTRKTKQIGLKNLLKKSTTDRNTGYSIFVHFTLNLNCVLTNSNINSIHTCLVLKKCQRISRELLWFTVVFVKETIFLNWLQTITMIMKLKNQFKELFLKLQM